MMLATINEIAQSFKPEIQAACATVKASLAQLVEALLPLL